MTFLRRDRRPGLTLLLGGLLLGVLPMLANGYLVQLIGQGCHP